MAKTRQTKTALLEQYKAWFRDSQASVVAEYTGLNMKSFDALRGKLRETGAEFHIIKNTLGLKALEELGIQGAEKILTGSTAIAFGFQDGSATAKAMLDFARTSEFLKVKGGLLSTQTITAKAVESLAELPPLPVMRAQLMGTIQAPASKLVRLLAEPGRQVAAVIKAHADQDAA